MVSGVTLCASEVLQENKTKNETGLSFSLMHIVEGLVTFSLHLKMQDLCRLRHICNFPE